MNILYALAVEAMLMKVYGPREFFDRHDARYADDQRIARQILEQFNRQEVTP